jgi:hypothetical protein
MYHVSAAFPENTTPCFDDFRNEMGGGRANKASVSKWCRKKQRKLTYLRARGNATDTCQQEVCRRLELANACIPTLGCETADTQVEVDT